MPTTYTAATISVPRRRPYSPITQAAKGATAMPPTDSPVNTTDRASARRRANHRVTTVLAVSMFVAENPNPKRAKAE